MLLLHVHEVKRVKVDHWLSHSLLATTMDQYVIIYYIWYVDAVTLN